MSVTNIVLTDPVITALQFIERYRYLTVRQVATITGMKAKSASEMLLRMQRQKLLSFFGNVPIRGYGKTPKVYFLTKRGHSILEEEIDDAAAAYRPVNRTTRWSPKMYHQIATIDVMMQVEQALAAMPTYRLVKTFVEYRRTIIDGRFVSETYDVVTRTHVKGDIIIPDAAFILENVDTGDRRLFLIEVDRATELLEPKRSSQVHKSFLAKMEQYDRYLLSGQFRERYADWGEFQNFITLTITTSQQRLENMRGALSTLMPKLHDYYRFSTFDEIMSEFFHNAWRSRNAGDMEYYRLLKGG